MKFAHIADCHLGGWREPKMREVAEEAFKQAIDKSVEEKVEFILIAGDLFNTAVPPIDSLRLAVTKLKEAKEAGIPTYIIAGSHDFSPSGKTMLDILEEAGLVKNVATGEETEQNQLRLKFAEDKSGAKITGLIGKRGALETAYYENLDRSIEQEKGYKIFMFHTALTELKPKEMGDMATMPTSMLPKGFDYYAGGHVHITDTIELQDHKNVVYPGPTYPNSFSEIEKLKHGTFVIVDDNKAEHVKIEPRKVKNIKIDAEGKTPTEVEDAIIKELDGIEGKIVTLRAGGQLKDGKPSDLNWQAILTTAYDRGAYFVMKNSNKLKSKEMERITINETSIEAVEDKLLKEQGEGEKAKNLMHILSTEKKDGEKTHDYEKRLIREVNSLLNIGA